MSLNIRWLTNGKKEIFTVRNSGVEPVSFEVFERCEDIDESIRHYAESIKKPTYCGPDLANMFRVLDIFYPNHGTCGRDDLKPHNPTRCIAESCKYGDEAGGYLNCKDYHPAQ